MSDWLWKRQLLPWQIKFRIFYRLRLHRLARFTYRECRTDIGISSFTGHPCWCHHTSVSHYWTPIGVWTHERRMRKIDAEWDALGL